MPKSRAAIQTHTIATRCRRLRPVGGPDESGVGDEDREEAGQGDHDVERSAGAIGGGDGDGDGSPQDHQHGREGAHQAAVGRVFGHPDGQHTAAATSVRARDHRPPRVPSWRMAHTYTHTVTTPAADRCRSGGKRHRS